MKIFLSGGGTLGPVMPLLAIAEICRQRDSATQFVWVGTKAGPERELVEKFGVPFFVIGAGKWRRYFSLLNVLDLFKLFIAFWQSLFLLWQEKPDLLISVGGFVSVPLHWAGALLGIPAWVHQQDVRPGLANRLMAPFARKITTALQDSVKFFPTKKTEWIGNPSRDLTIGNPTEARKKFNLPANAPVIFALGGGTGSNYINRITLEGVSAWPRDWQIIHLTGKERPDELAKRAMATFPNYHVYQFFGEEMAAAYAVADLVVARAGFATLAELAALSKPAIIVPMNGTHQEDNARYFAEREAVIVLPEQVDGGLKLTQLVKELMADPAERARLGQHLHELLPRASADKILEIIDSLLKSPL